MNKAFKPEGYNSVSPYFIVEDAQRMVDLLKEIFDAKELRRYERPDGSIMHLEMQLDDSVMMLSAATDQYPANQFLLHVYVPDATKTYQKALELGCKGLEEPKQKEGDPDKRGMFQDFGGNVWAVGTQVSDSK